MFLNLHCVTFNNTYVQVVSKKIAALRYYCDMSFQTSENKINNVMSGFACDLMLNVW